MTIRTTDDVQYDKQGLPVGTYTVLVVSEEDDKDGRGIIVEYEVVSGEFKKSKGKVWYLFNHSNHATAKIAEGNLKRLADATGKKIPLCLISERPSGFTPIKNRALVIEVRQQKKNPDYTEIAKYHPENYVAPQSDDVPFA